MNDSKVILRKISYASRSAFRLKILLVDIMYRFRSLRRLQRLRTLYLLDPNYTLRFKRRLYQAAESLLQTLWPVTRSWYVNSFVPGRYGPSSSASARKALGLAVYVCIWEAGFLRERLPKRMRVMSTALELPKIRPTAVLLKRQIHRCAVCPSLPQYSLCKSFCFLS